MDAIRNVSSAESTMFTFMASAYPVSVAMTVSCRVCVSNLRRLEQYLSMM